MEDNELFINTFLNMKPGEIHSGFVYDKDERDRQTIIQIVRPATKEEYIEMTKKMKLTHMVARSIDNPNLKFYLVKVLD